MHIPIFELFSKKMKHKKQQKLSIPLSAHFIPQLNKLTISLLTNYKLHISS